MIAMPVPRIALGAGAARIVDRRGGMTDLSNRIRYLALQADTDTEALAGTAPHLGRTQPLEEERAIAMVVEVPPLSGVAMNKGLSLL